MNFHAQSMCSTNCIGSQETIPFQRSHATMHFIRHSLNIRLETGKFHKRLFKKHHWRIQLSFNRHFVTYVNVIESTELNSVDTLLLLSYCNRIICAFQCAQWWIPWWFNVWRTGQRNDSHKQTLSHFWSHTHTVNERHVEKQYNTKRKKKI